MILMRSNPITMFSLLPNAEVCKYTSICKAFTSTPTKHIPETNVATLEVGH